MAAEQWPDILNDVIMLLQKHVDRQGKGIFSFREVLKGTKYERQSVTILKYLSGLGVLVRGKRTEGRQFSWQLKPRKVTLRDVRRVRTANSTSAKAISRNGVKAKSKVAVKTQTISLEKSMDRTRRNAKSSSLHNSIKAVEALSKQNRQLRNKVAELEAELAEMKDFAERITTLVNA